MAENSAIEWCDHTFNPWEGCQRVSPGCDHCYAEARNARFGGGAAVNWGPAAPRRRTSAANWRKSLRWQKEAPTWQAALGRRQRVFCASLADWLDNAVPIAWLVDLLELIRTTPDLDWLLLSKRIGNWSIRISEAIGFLDEQTPAAYPLPLRAWLCHWLDGDKAPHNVWLGATVVNQAEADRDVPKLVRVPAAVRFLSIEPMLGPVDLTSIARAGSPGAMRPLDGRFNRLHWVICGGESGPKARPMHPEWVRSLRDQCAAAGVPFLFKQWGEWPEVDGDKPIRTVPVESDIGETLASRCDGFISQAGEFVRSMDDATTDDPYRGMQRLGKKAAGRLLDGRTHDGFPEAVYDAA